MKPDYEEWSSIALLDLQLPQDGDSRSAGEQVFFYTDLPKRLEDLKGSLSFDTGEAGLFLSRDVARAYAPVVEFFFFEFAAGNPQFINDVLGHAPEVCMEEGGADLITTHPIREFEVAGEKLSLRHLEFERPGAAGRYHVFRTTWLPEGSFYETYIDGREQRKQRIAGALKGNPRPPARTLLAGMRNFTSPREAREAFEGLLLDHLEMKKSK